MRDQAHTGSHEADRHSECASCYKLSQVGRVVGASAAPTQRDRLAEVLHLEAFECDRDYDGYCGPSSHMSHADALLARGVRVVDPAPLRYSVTVEVEVDPLAYDLEYSEDPTPETVGDWIAGTVEDAVANHPLAYLYQVTAVDQSPKGRC